MAHATAPALVLREGDKEELRAWSGSSAVSAGLAQRARIVLLAAEGIANTEIAQRFILRLNFIAPLSHTSALCQILLGKLTPTVADTSVRVTASPSGRRQASTPLVNRLFRIEGVVGV